MRRASIAGARAGITVPASRCRPELVVYLCAVDREGNIASLIQSIYQAFGSGIVVPEYGVALHNRGALFSLDPAHPNALAGRKRPFHTIIPALMFRAPDCIICSIVGGNCGKPGLYRQFVSTSWSG